MPASVGDTPLYSLEPMDDFCESWLCRLDWPVGSSFLPWLAGVERVVLINIDVGQQKSVQ